MQIQDIVSFSREGDDVGAEKAAGELQDELTRQTQQVLGYALVGPDGKPAMRARQFAQFLGLDNIGYRVVSIELKSSNLQVVEPRIILS